MKVYQKHLSQPWFDLIRRGEKTVEGRLNKGDFLAMQPNDIIEFFNDDGKKFRVKVVSKKLYPSFEKMIKEERLKHVLPTIRTIKEGVNIYHQYYKPVHEKKLGVIAVRIRII